MKRAGFIFGLIVFLHVSLHAQQADFVQDLHSKLGTYFKKNLPVKLHLFFNQPQYAPGDTAYFKASFLSADEYRPIGGRQIIQVYLADGKGVPVLEQRVLLANGFGFNQIAIPATLTPGIYTVVAYSDWMKNQDASLYFYSSLFICGEKKWIREEGDQITYYPEGGNLVASVSNRIAVKGKPGASLKIVNSANNELTAGQLDETGWTSLYVAPTYGEEYFIQKDNGARQKLMPSQQNRVAMLLTVPKAKSPIRIVLQTNENSFQNGGGDFYLVVSARGNTYYSTRVDLREKKSTIILVPQDQLPAGISLATVFRGDGSVEAERLFFVDPVRPVVSAGLERYTYGVREKVKVRLQVRDGNSTPVKSRIAVTVFNSSLFTDATPDNSLDNFMTLTSDLAYGPMLNVPSARTTSSALDNLLITQSWKRFRWEDVWKDVVKNQYTFKSNLHFAGRAFIGNSKDPLPDSTAITFFLQRDVMTYKIYPEPDGTFDFPLLLDFVNNDEVYFRAETRGKLVENVRIEAVHPDRVDVKSPVFKQSQELNSFGIFATQKNQIDQAYQLPTKKQEYLKPPGSPHALIEEEVFGPNISVNLDDYLLFPNMEETLREIIPYVQHRWHRGKSEVRVWIDDLGILATGPPLYFIDGVLTDDTDYFMSLKPENVSTIHVINTQEKLRAFGAIGKNAIILVETKILNNAPNVPRSSSNFLVNGLTPPAFWNKHDNKLGKNLRYPALYPSLYWNPEIVTDDQGVAEISFYTGDNTGTFIIRVDGITFNGEPVSSEESFEVKFEKNGSH